jgi:hypothetical protein
VAGEVPKYQTSVAGAELRQGEIMSTVIQVRLREGAALAGPDARELVEVVHRWTILATQDCDLEQDFRARQGATATDKVLPNALLCMAQEAAGVQVAGKDVWKRLQQNKDERYQFLERVPPEGDALGQGVPELVVDFKQYFTLPTDELYERVRQGQALRRCRLVNEYLLHFASRFSYYQSRVALPHEHASE